eukprot:6767485-Heterocapsa_arctica.AAC.1
MAQALLAPTAAPSTGPPSAPLPPPPHNWALEFPRGHLPGEQVSVFIGCVFCSPHTVWCPLDCFQCDPPPSRPTSALDSCPPSLFAHRTEVRREQRENLPVSICPRPLMDIWDGAPPFGVRARCAFTSGGTRLSAELLRAGLRHALLPSPPHLDPWRWATAAFAHGTTLHGLSASVSPP